MPSKAAQHRYRRTEKAKAASKRYKETHREYYASKQRERYAADKEFYASRAFCKLYGTEPELLRQVRERDKDCQLCGSLTDLQFDHIVPIVLGGKASFENLQLLCASCNKFKHCHLLLPEGGMLRVRRKDISVSR